MSFVFYENQLRQQYRLLAHKGFWTQAHCHDVNTGKVVSRELLYGEEKVIAWAKENNGKGNCFIGRNPRNDSGDVQYCAALTLDLDPIRDKGTAASEQAVRDVLRAGRGIVITHGYGVLASSGNGALLIFPLREPVTKDVAEGWGKALEAQAREFLRTKGINNVQVDATFDGARLCKALGTISTKGNRNLWRYARFIDGVSHNVNAEASFRERLTASPQMGKQEVSRLLPALERGHLDRSKADFALGLSLKQRGFGPEDAFKALCATSAREGREDDCKRIVQKLFFEAGAVVGEQAGERPIELWTPESGMQGYQARAVNTIPELPTGYSGIDRATYGLQRGHIFTVGARTNCGKTTFAIGTAVNLCRLGKRTLFVSTETTYHEVWDRYIAASTGVSAFAIQHHITNGSTGQVEGFLKEFGRHQLTVYDGSRPNITVLRRACEAAQPDVLIFDYFQHVESRETRELEEFVMQVKELAKEKQIAVLMCAQLHDRYNPQTGKQYPPTLQDMKSCKVLNDESRVVLLLDWNRDGATGDGPAAVKVIMAKNKGVKEDILLKLDRTVPRFLEDP